MAKVSFDFDSTLNIDVVQKLAKNIIDEGHEVWIVTSRIHGVDSSGNKRNNDDLFEIANELNIFKEQIHFCNMANKSEFLKDKGFLWHLDDDEIELQFIRMETNVLPIHRRGGNDWWNQCLDSIRIFG